MDAFFRIMAILIEYPILALAPAVLFGHLYHRSRVGLCLGTASAWIAYAIYEYGISYRLFCTGECNIRVDLLFLYPLLLGLSLMSVGTVLANRGEKA
jgi:hypothetical protein